jgi:hypothetical protein
MLWIVKFYEGGLSLTELLDMSFDKLLIVIEETEQIANHVNGK